MSFLTVLFLVTDVRVVPKVNEQFLDDEAPETKPLRIKARCNYYLFYVVKLSI